MKIESISISNELIVEMKNHVNRCLPEEGCGILAGLNGAVKAVLPITNQAHSAVRFYVDPVELLHAFNWIEINESELTAIFHSHPNGPETPSETDIRNFFYPGVATIILSKSKTKWQVRAFMIDGDTYKEIRLISYENS
jgi:proteasome lid subunit RPN8/RPN11